MEHVETGHVAILYKRINLGYGNYTFRPIRVLEGYYDPDNNTFIENKNGNTNSYAAVNDIYARTNYDLYFDFPERLEDLKEEFDYALTKEDIEYEYLNNRAKMHVDATLDEISGTSTIVYPQITVDTEEKVEEPAKPKIPEIKMGLLKLREEVLKKVISQDKAVEVVTRTIFKNYRAKNPANKSHILIVGPTGTGKTYLVETISKIIGVPFHRVDATDLVAEGYVGKHVNDVLVDLINKCNGDVKAAEYAILAIDEIDKKKTRNDSDAISTKDVMDNLLKLAARGVIDVTMPGAFGGSRTISFDTSNLTIVFMGACAGIVDEKSKRINLGFGAEGKVGLSNYADIKTEHLVKYGFTPELLGRVPCKVLMRSLDTQDLIDIMNNSEDSQLKRAIEFYKDENVELIATDDYKDAIAHSAKENDTGARSLTTAINESLEYTDDEVLIKNDPNNTDEKVKIKKIKVTAETVKDPKKYYVE